MNKKIVIILIFIGLILIFVATYSTTKVSDTSPNLNFSTDKCDSNVNPYSLPKEGILNKTWKNQNTLIVEGYVKTFCDGADLTGDYAVEGNNLILKYKIIIGDFTECNCAHKVIYEFSNLDKKEYSISLTSE